MVLPLRGYELRRIVPDGIIQGISAFISTAFDLI